MLCGFPAFKVGGKAGAGCAHSERTRQLLGRPGDSRKAHRAGKVTPAIERTCPLSDIPETLDSLAEGYGHRNVAISV